MAKHEGTGLVDTVAKKLGEKLQYTRSNNGQMYYVHDWGTGYITYTVQSEQQAEELGKKLGVEVEHSKHYVEHRERKDTVLRAGGMLHTLVRSKVEKRVRIGNHTPKFELANAGGSDGLD